VGIDRWLPKDATMTHRNVMAARFLHVAQDPSRRTAGLLWAMLAGVLLVACPIALMAVPNVLIYIGIYTEIYIESTQELVDEATLDLLLLHIVLFVALMRTAVRHRSSAVRMKPHGMAVADLKSFILPLPSGRDVLVGPGDDCAVLAACLGRESRRKKNNGSAASCCAGSGSAGRRRRHHPDAGVARYRTGHRHSRP